MIQADWVKERLAIEIAVNSWLSIGEDESEYISADEVGKLKEHLKDVVCDLLTLAQQRTEKKWRDKYNEAKLDKIFSLDRDHSNEYQLGVKETFASLDYDLLK